MKDSIDSLNIWHTKINILYDISNIHKSKKRFNNF